MEAPQCSEYNDYFELELVLDYENAVPLPQGGVGTAKKLVRSGTKGLWLILSEPTPRG